MLKRMWWWFLPGLSLSPSLAYAETIHASGYVRPFIFILVICLLAGIALYAIRYWSAEMAKIWVTLPKIFTFIVVIIAIIWIIVILAGLAGVRIT